PSVSRRVRKTSAMLSHSGSATKARLCGLRSPVMAVAKEPVYYWSYLHLDELLGAQQPLSEPPAHAELLFIVVHQAFDLWFHPILFELDDVLAVMGRDIVAERDMGEVVARLQRITRIQRLRPDP